MRFSILLFLVAMGLHSQDCITINHVFKFTPGTGQNIGQSEEYFPANIFGIPSRIASEQVAEASQDEVLSLGFGGEIIVGNTDNLIVDKEGADFTIFENVFLNPITQKLFKEPAVVSVSRDGVHYVDFPYNYENLEGCAGTHVTYGDANYCDAKVSGGDSFDLSTVAMDSIRYIKIRDITVDIKDEQNHKYWDVSLSGFDLDAVVIHNFVQDKMTSVEEESGQTYQLQGNSIVSNSPENKFVIYSLMGAKVSNFNGLGIFKFDDLPNGIYIIEVANNFGEWVEKVIIL